MRKGGKFSEHLIPNFHLRNLKYIGVILNLSPEANDLQRDQFSFNFIWWILASAMSVEARACLVSFVTPSIPTSSPSLLTLSTEMCSSSTMQCISLNHHHLEYVWDQFLPLLSPNHRWPIYRISNRLSIQGSCIGIESDIFKKGPTWYNRSTYGVSPDQWTVWWCCNVSHAQECYLQLQGATLEQWGGDYQTQDSNNWARRWEVEDM